LILRISFHSIRIIVPVVPESTAPDREDDNEKDEHDDVDDRHLLPVILDVGKHTGLARLAIEAQLGLVALPGVAVADGGVVAEPCRLVPHSFAPVGEVADSWRLAASRLQNEETREKSIRRSSKC